MLPAQENRVPTSQQSNSLSSPPLSELIPPPAIATSTPQAPPAPSQQPTTIPMPPVTTNVNVHVQAAQPVIVINAPPQGQGFLVRAVWFFLVGWWLSFFWIGAAWALNVTILLLPLGVWMLNRLPAVLTLKMQQKQTSVTMRDGVMYISQTTLPQRPFWQRALYFVAVGWWLSLIWLYVAWVFCVLIITLPLGLVMFNSSPLITTLRRG